MQVGILDWPLIGLASYLYCMDYKSPPAMWLLFSFLAAVNYLQRAIEIFTDMVWFVFEGILS